jgi:hypothetical protein
VADDQSSLVLLSTRHQCPGPITRACANHPLCLQLCLTQAAAINQVLTALFWLLQAVRNQDDLETLACPPKYRAMNDFWKYYSGQKKPPYPTIFSA